MVRGVVGGVMWEGRVTVFLVGLAVILARCSEPPSASPRPTR